MARSKTVKKRRSTPDRRVKFKQNLEYWSAVNRELARQAGFAPVASVSDALPCPELVQALVQPPTDTVAKLKDGSCTFSDYWKLMQAIYFMSHVVSYLKSYERYSSNDEATVLMVKVQMDILEAKCLTEYASVMESIGERHRTTGKYRMTGDECRTLEDVLHQLNELMQWATLRSIHWSATEVCKRLNLIEHSIATKVKDKGFNPETLLIV